jgi:hypothetical protein
VRPADWDFFSFPTFFAFAAGMFIGSILIFSGLGPIIFTGSLFLFSFGLAHIVTRQFARHRLEQREERAAEDERERRALAARARQAELAAESGEDERGHEHVQRRRRRRRR